MQQTGNQTRGDNLYETVKTMDFEFDRDKFSKRGHGRVM